MMKESDAIHFRHKELNLEYTETKTGMRLLPKKYVNDIYVSLNTMRTVIINSLNKTWGTNGN